MVTARLLRKFKFTTDVTPFVMELPPYPHPHSEGLVAPHMGQGSAIPQEMGGVILVASIIVWALNYFPIHDREATVADADDAQLTTAISDDSQIDVHRGFISRNGRKDSQSRHGTSWISLARLCAALAGIPAKEIVVSTLGVLYTGDEEIDDSSLSHA